MRARLSRRPAGLLACVVVAMLNALAWTALTPPFQVPDEPVHVGYVQYLAEAKQLPVPAPAPTYSEELELAQELLPFSAGGDPMWLKARSDRMERFLAENRFDRVQPLGAGWVGPNPPLYYALQSITYKVGSAAAPWDRLMLMRLFSVLLTGVLVGFVFLFLRELMPTRPLAWKVGALGVGLHPLLGFIGGGVNPDPLLWALCAALFYLLARAFHRGLDVPTGLALGLVAFAAMLTKLAFLTVLPGLAVALALAALAAPPEKRRRALMGAAVAVAATAGPWLIWQAVSAAAFDRVVAGGALSTDARGRPLNLREGLSYVWQFYLPKLPFMTDQFADYPTYPLWEVYFKGFVGRFGWFAYGFPTWVNFVGLAFFGAILAAAGAALVRARDLLRPRLLELLAYTAIAGSVLLLVNASGYRYRLAHGFDFEQTRYLFPLLPLYGALLGVAVQAAGRRYAVPAAVFLVVVLGGHTLFSQALSLYHYYV